VHRHGKCIQFSVQDQGIGIPENELSRVFNAFERTSAMPTGTESSTGLGLSICKRLVELHYGSIHVESAAGAGSHFYFRLPIQSQDS
jgi:signal transduction histidine kinase